MSKKTIAIITIIVTGIILLFFIVLRSKKQMDKTELSSKSNTTIENLNIESKTMPPTEFDIESWTVSPTHISPPTYNGKPILLPTEQETEITYDNPIQNEKIDIIINGINVTQINYLNEFYDTGYCLDKRTENKMLNYNEIDNPFVHNRVNKEDQIMIVIRNTETLSKRYSECIIKKIMCDFSKCKANIFVGKYNVESLNPDNLVKTFGTPKAFLTDKETTYISYQAKNLQFDFEFKDEKIISLLINLK